jgi:NAD(P)-dependent dehydrogenase (short-subunit alcohol dehydrogenase family)
MGAYAASKGRRASLTQSLAEELKGDNVTVNAVLPSILDTAANRADMPKADSATGWRRRPGGGDAVPGERGLDRGDRRADPGDRPRLTRPRTLLRESRTGCSKSSQITERGSLGVRSGRHWPFLGGNARNGAMDPDRRGGRAAGGS